MFLLKVRGDCTGISGIGNFFGAVGFFNCWLGMHGPKKIFGYPSKCLPIKNTANPQGLAVIKSRFFLILSGDSYGREQSLNGSQTLRNDRKGIACHNHAQPDSGSLISEGRSNDVENGEKYRCNDKHEKRYFHEFLTYTLNEVHRLLLVGLKIGF